MKQIERLKVKKILTISIFNVLLSIVLLIGTTYALLTSEDVERNAIVTGQIDVNLYHESANTEGYTEVTNKTKLFEQELWEPGVRVYEKFKIENKGNILAKYQFSLMVGDGNFTLNTNKSLHDILEVAVLDSLDEVDTSEEYVNIDDFETLVNTKFELNATDEFYIVIRWKPGVSDDAYNVNGRVLTTDGKPLYIEVGVRLYAVQINGSFYGSES